MLIKGNFFLNWKDGYPALSLGPAEDKVIGNYFSTTSTTSKYFEGAGNAKTTIEGNDFVIPASYNTTVIDGAGVVAGNTFTLGNNAGSSAKVIKSARLVDNNSIVFGSGANAASVGISDCTQVGEDNYISGAGIAISPVPVVSTQFDKTTNTTLADVTGLTKAMQTAGTYAFEAVLFIDADATGGSKYAINSSGTAATIKYEIMLLDDTTDAFTIVSRHTSLGSSAGQAGTTAGLCRIRGVIKTSSSGNLTVQFAQNASNGTSSVLVGSYLEVHQLT